MQKIQETKINLKGKKVFLRCDFNVPLGKDGKILDDLKIKKTIPTIKYLIKKKAKVILASHLGKPEGKFQKELSLSCIQNHLLKYLGFPVSKAPDCIGKMAKKAASTLKEGEVLLLENLRFHPGEEKNSLLFAQKLASLAEIYVNDAFGAIHRAHASIFHLPKLLPAFGGFLLQEEVENLTKVMKKPKKPLVIVIGGKKVETKIPVIQNLLPLANWILVGGKLVLEGIPFSDKKIILAKLMGHGFDIKKESIFEFKTFISKAKTIIWNGPMGWFEKKEFEKGTKEIGKAISRSFAFKIAGGGETILAIKKYHLENKFDFISTGGGAMLEFLGGKELPGLKALK